jgi:hypothetical protein
MVEGWGGAAAGEGVCCVFLVGICKEELGVCLVLFFGGGEGGGWWRVGGLAWGGGVMVGGWGTREGK